MDFATVEEEKLNRKQAELLIKGDGGLQKSKEMTAELNS